MITRRFIKHRGRNLSFVLWSLCLGFCACAGPGRDGMPADSFPPPSGESGRAKIIFLLTPEKKEIPIEQVASAILIEMERKERTQGAVERWPGDTAGRYEYIDIRKREFRPSDLQQGVLELPPGFYRVEHNSVKGSPPAGMYGRSGVFEIKSREATEVSVFLYPAI